jgi:hypothetical protein
MLESIRFSNDRATTAPAACSADDRGILETRLRKILAYFPRLLRIFPQQIYPPRKHIGKNSVKLRLYIM